MNRINRLPYELQRKIFKNVFDESIKDLKRFVKDKREIYPNYAKIDKDSLSLFQYLRFCGLEIGYNHEEFSLYYENLWEPYWREQKSLYWWNYFNKNFEEFKNFIEGAHPDAVEQYISDKELEMIISNDSCCKEYFIPIPN